MRQLTGELKPKVKTSLGVSIQQDHISRKKTIIEFGTLSDTQTRVNQKELWTNVVENTVIDEAPTVVGKQRGIITPVDSQLASLPILDGCEQVYRMEVLKSGLGLVLSAELLFHDTRLIYFNRNAIFLWLDEHDYIDARIKR